jgi:LmbE family N-acetylglucosaminyl deacetylase
MHHEPRHRCGLEVVEPALRHRAEISVLIVVAHPDDETIGMGATLGTLADRGARVEILHVTNGAPRDPSLRPSLRHCAPAEAARFRRAELQRALRAGGLDGRVVLAPSLGVPDQSAALCMTSIARSLAARIREKPVDVVVTHPYEGGHPDHDAVAFAVHAAARLRPRGVVFPAIIELSSYHAVDGAFRTGTFLAPPASPTTEPDAFCTMIHEGRLDAAARARKRAMLAAFASQSDVLASFDVAAEPLRCAPPYDFTRPPHPGPMHYERLPFGWTGERWRDLARAWSVVHGGQR